MLARASQTRADLEQPKFRGNSANSDFYLTSRLRAPLVFIGLIAPQKVILATAGSNGGLHGFPLQHRADAFILPGWIIATVVSVTSGVERKTQLPSHYFPVEP